MLSNCNCIPAEVWGIVFSYAVEPLSVPPHFSSGIALLRKSVSTGLRDLFLERLLEENLDWRTRHALTVRELAMQKQCALALNDAPRELLATVRSIEGPFLVAERRYPTYRSPASTVVARGSGGITSTSTTVVRTRSNRHLSFLGFLSNVERIEGPFLSQASAWLQILDLRTLEALRTIGDDFLYYASFVEEVHLPVRLQSVGHRFLSGTSIKAMDFSHTALSSVHDEFLNFCSLLSRVSLPTSLATAGRRFLAYCPQLEAVELSQTSLKVAGDKFLAASAVIGNVTLPATLSTVGVEFMIEGKAAGVELAETKLLSFPEKFLSKARVERIAFPNCLQVVRERCLYEGHFKVVDLSNTLLTEVGKFFMGQSEAVAVVFPPSLQTLQSYGFLCQARVDVLDMSQTKIESLDDWFLTSVDIRRSLLLPPRLTAVGGYFLPSRRTGVVDLSATCLATVGPHCLYHSKILELKLPTTLRYLADGFLFACHCPDGIDLSLSSVTSIGIEFLGAAKNVKLLKLPATLTSIDKEFAARSAVEVVDLSLTSVTDLKSGFLLSATIRRLHLPFSIRHIEDGFMEEARLEISPNGDNLLPYGDEEIRLEVALDFSDTGLESIGPRFLAKARIGSGFARRDTESGADEPEEDEQEEEEGYEDEDGPKPQLLFPSSLTSIETGFLLNCRAPTTLVDLLESSLKSLPADFLRGGVVDTLILPSSLTCVGDYFLHQATVRVVDLSATAVEALNPHFLRSATIRSAVLFPPCLTSIGAWFMYDAKAQTIDLSGTEVKSLRARFMEKATVDRLTLPRRLAAIRDELFVECHIAVLDLSQASRLQRLESKFLSEAGTQIGSILLPQHVMASEDGQEGKKGQAKHKQKR